jgi:outer membrane receptor protein involved in Fe transport
VHTVRYGLRVEPLPALVLSLWGRATTRIRTLDPIAAPGSAFALLPPVALLDGSVMYTWRDLTFQLIATNLTDRRYELGGTVPRPLPGPGLDLQAALLWRL